MKGIVCKRLDTALGKDGAAGAQPIRDWQHGTKLPHGALALAHDYSSVTFRACASET
jgi:hypothetical protein